jgi:signal transduction histidine kinase
MFFGLAKEDFTIARSRQVLPAFLLLATFCMVLVLGGILQLRSYLRTIERDETSRLLTGYLNTHRLLGRLSPSLPLRDEDLLQGLVFVRISQGAEQLLLVGDDKLSNEMQHLLDVPIEMSRIWYKVHLGDRLRILTLYSAKLSERVTVQVAKDSEKNYEYFRAMARMAALLAILALVLAWLLALLALKNNLRPIFSARRRIRALMADHTELLPESGNGPEVDQLYQQLNRLITDNRRLVATMQQSLDNVAHDLRTPMTRLRSVAEYGLQSDDRQRLQEALSDCLEESERVLAMLKIMMSVAEAESGTMHLQCEQLDLCALIQQVLVMYEYVAEEKNITVEFSSANPVWGEVDRTRMSQVLANLVDNAIKYGRAGGWVRLVVEGDDATVTIVVKDNGIGISAAEKSKIWERLYRGDRSRSQPGLGLGLSYVRAVVQAHGGSVQVESVLGEGSSFSVRLPKSQVCMQEKSQTSGEWSESRTSAT